MQKAILILVVALAASGEASFLSRDVLPVGLTSTFGSFFKLPRTIQEAKAQNWIETQQPDDVPEIYKELKMYSYECDGPVSILYEPHSGCLAALQVAIDKDTFSAFYDLVENGFKLWTSTCGGVERTRYFIRVYLVTEVFLSKSPDERISSYNTSKIMQEDKLVAMGPGGKLLEISANGTKIRTESDFTQQSCIYWMGTHYYYNMSKTTECTAQGIYPWFPLIHGDNGYRQDLIGIGFLVIGKDSKQAGSRNWHEDPNELAVRAIVNKGPDCLYKAVGKYGVKTLHFYFVENPKDCYC